MKRLITHANGRKVFLIVDRHPAHKAKVVKALLKDHADVITLHVLPSYSPELHPDECLNHDLNAQTVRRTPPKSDEHLLTMVRGHLRSR